jgi:hypothetical protein
MDNEQNITGVINRALVSRGSQRIADLREALALAVESHGAKTVDMSSAPQATNSLTANKWGLIVEGKATANLASIANLRAMLNDDGIKGNAKALASIVRAIRQLH